MPTLPQLEAELRNLTQTKDAILVLRGNLKREHVMRLVEVMQTLPEAQQPAAFFHLPAQTDIDTVQLPTEEVEAIQAGLNKLALSDEQRAVLQQLFQTHNPVKLMAVLMRE